MNDESLLKDGQYFFSLGISLDHIPINSVRKSRFVINNLVDVET